MPYIVTVTNQVKSIGITESPAYTVQVQDPTTAQFNITETANTVSIFESLSTTSIYLNAIELKLNDLNDFWRGEWVANTADYLHGDLVSYEYSVFLLSVYSEDGTAFYPASDVPPTEDANWIRLVWHEAPFQYIVDNGSLDVYGVSTFHNTAVTDGALIANGTSTFNALATFNSDIDAQSNLTVYGDLSVGGTSEGYKLLIRGDSKFDGNVYIVNTTTFAGNIEFNNTIINGDATFTGNIEFTKNLNVNSLVINDTLYINGLAYPHSKGLYGQVLTTNGVNTATWVNLGDLVFWSLSDDLRTNGHRIVSGSYAEDLLIGVGPAGADPQSSINFYPNFIDIKARPGSGGGPTSAVSLSAGNSAIPGIPLDRIVVATDSGITIDASNSISVTGPITTFNADDKFQVNADKIKLVSTGDIDLDPANGQYINILGTLKFADGTTQNTANTGSGGTSTYTLPIASTSTLGGIRIGDNLAIDGDGILSAIGAGFYTLPPATSDTLGGIKVSGYFSLNPSGTLIYNPPYATEASFGVVKIGTTLDVNSGVIDYNLPKASTGTLGGIRVGENLSIDGSGILSATGAGFYNLPTATSSVLGGIKVGNSLDIVDGVLDYALPVASSSTLGGVKIGENISINAYGYISANTSTVAHAVSLTEDLLTNGYNIVGGVHSLTIGATGLLLANNNSNIYLDTNDLEINTNYTLAQSAKTINIQAFNDLNLTSENLSIVNTGTVSVSSDNLNVSSTGTVRIGVGNGTQESVLNVNRIYNYNGNYAPLFPAGIQFGDQTVQRTAFEPDNGLLPPVINYIGTVAYADAGLFAALDPTPQYYDGITTLDNGHVWLFIAEGYPSLVPGWYDAG